MNSASFKFNFIFFFITCLFSLNLLSQSVPKVSYPLTPENYKTYKDYIFSDAPANMRVILAVDVIGLFNLSREYHKSVKIGLELLEAFNEDKVQYDYYLNLIRNYSQFMLTVVPAPEDFDIFDKFIKDNVNNYLAITAIKKMAGYYTNKNKWDSAVYIWEKYIEILPKYETEIDKTITLLKQNPRGLIVKQLGTMINTKGDEWDPNPSIDGKYLYFSASNRNGGKGGSDIWVAENINGVWQSPKNLNANVNSERDETIDNISLDGNTLLLSGNFAGTFGNFDIYFLEKDSNSWGALRHLPSPINSEYTDEAANLSADGQVLLFTSDRPGGVGEFRAYNSGVYNGGNMGNLDIYVSKKVNGRWTEPINLGETINTPFAERSAYLHPDGKTLYFSSDGHYGLGNLDVYMSKRLNDTSWTEWSEPVNLGKEINSILDDWGYKISLNGDSAVFSAYNRLIGSGGWDLFSINLPPELKPEEIISIKGKIIDEDGNPVFANVIWEDLELNTYLGELNSNPENGEFLVALTKGKFYGYFVKKDGYYPSSAFLDLRNKINKNEIEITIKLIKIDNFKKGKSIIVNNLFFDFDSYELKKESIPELNRLAEFLKSNKNKIEIIGHTDSEGNEKYNKDLSLKRANSVKEFLVKKGINKNLLDTKGMGESAPLKQNTSDENKSLNRRVEIKIK